MFSWSLPSLRGRRAPTLRTTLISLVVLCVLTLWLAPHVRSSSARSVPVGPLTRKYVENDYGVGGRWFIPSSWQRRSAAPESLRSLSPQSSVLDAAEQALDLALQNKAFIENTKIPLIAHQTWRSFDTNGWPDIVRKSVEVWIDAAVVPDSPSTPKMAWFLWDDDGIDALVRKYEPGLYDLYKLLPYPVEKADLFRIVVVKWFGGIYADVDVELLKHPSAWVYKSDLAPWTDSSKKSRHTLHVPKNQCYKVPDDSPDSYKSIFSPKASLVSTLTSKSTVMSIFGIEADSPPPPDDTYWRMGYTHSVQLTNWALAMAPHHPVAAQFLETLADTIQRNRTRLRQIDPLDITGPPALTTAVRAVAAAEEPRLTWQSLSGLKGEGSEGSGGGGDAPGGRGKAVSGDTMILPITGFSPGRGWFHNMGSQSARHRNARLRHAAAGSWRKVDLKVHYGKFCRTFFGMCREWKKIPDVADDAPSTAAG